MPPFDGDEGNISVPQGEMAQAEMEEQMHINNKILSTQCGYNIIDNIQDVIISMFFLTSEGQLVERSTFFNLCLLIDFKGWEDVLKRAAPYYKKYFKKSGAMKKYAIKNGLPGRVVISIIFPPSFSYNNHGVVIENGIMIDGVLKKNTLGSKQNTIIHKMAIEYGTHRAAQFATEIGWISNEWSCVHGYTFGLMDCLTTKKDEVKKTLKKAEEKVQYIMSTNKKKHEKEALIIETLNNVTSIGQKLAKDGMHGGEKNAMSVATISGAKGNYHNLMAISGCLGLHTVKGKRMTPELCEGTRILPCFRRDDNRLEANSFVPNNYLGGIGPADSFFSAWSTRDGLINTAVTTQESGYGHRRFEKKMENLRTAADGTIRDCNGVIIDYCYGEYGLSGTKIYYVDGIPFFCSVESIAKMCNTIYLQSGGDKDKPMFALTDKHVDSMVKNFRFNDTDGIVKTKDRVIFVLKEQVKKAKIYRESSVIKMFIKKIIDMYNSAIIPSGEMVGGKASNALGEDGTQGALNAFHAAGRSTKTTTTGLSRLKEIIDLKDKDKLKITSSSFEYKDKILRTGNEREQTRRICELRKLFEYTQLKDIAKIKLEKIKDVETNEYESLLGIHKTHKVPSWVSLYCKLMEIDPLEEYDYVLVIDCDKEMLYKYRLTLHEIVDKIESDEFVAVPSPPKLSKIYIYPVWENIEGKKGYDSERYYYARNEIAKLLENTHITGIPGIKTIYHAGGNRIDVQGNNFPVLMNHPKVIFSTLTTDVIYEVSENLGIDAAYIFICQELSKVFTKKISPCNIMLLARAMTRDGKLMNVSRYGISDDVGIITKMMNETVMNIITHGAVWGARDNMKSAASAYILGSLGEFGTSTPSFKLLSAK